VVCCSNGKTTVVDALVSAGADVNTQCNNSYSALGVASEKGHSHIVNILLDNGARIEIRDKLGRTPLWLAAANGQTDAVEALVSAGADVNTQCNDGNSALYIANQKEYIDIVDILLDSGATIEDRSTPLLFAATNGDGDTLRALVSAGADVNTQNDNGSSALGVACQKGYIDIVNILLHYGAEIETRDNEGRTPLLFAAINRQTDVVRALVSAGADVNTQSNDGISALGIASQREFIGIVNILLEHGSVIETRDRLGRTPLWFAAGNGKTDVVRALVSAGADGNTRNNDGISPLGYTSQAGYIDIVNMLLDNGADIETRDDEGRTPLYFAAACGQTDVIRALVSASAQSNGNVDSGPSREIGDSPSRSATWQSSDVTNLKPSRAADDDAFKYNACDFVAWGNREARTARGKQDILEYECSDPLNAATKWCEGDVEEILKLLLNNGSCVNSAKHGVNQSAFMSAVCRGRMDIANALAMRGADISDRNFDNVQPIDVASYCGHADIVQFLTNCSTSATALGRCSLYPASDVGVDCRCNTAMHLTTDLETMISLLANGADVEAENVDGLRPIHCAVRTGLVELVELLIQHGANIDAADVFGNRPLHEAVSHGRNVVQLLVQRGAKLNVQNIDGKTPLHIAVERQQSDVIVFLLSQDADVGLTDVWRNTPLHYFTIELGAVSEVAESVVDVLAKCRQCSATRNSVGVCMSKPMTTDGITHNRCQEEPHSDSKCTAHLDPPLYCDRVTQAHDVNLFLNWHKPNVDCYGNTPLHYAVGVYGQLKMFKVSTDVTNTVDFLVKCGADINA